MFLFKEATQAKDPETSPEASPGALALYPAALRSVPASLFAFPLGGTRPSRLTHSQLRLAPRNPGWGGSLVYTSSKARFILYPEWNPPKEEEGAGPCHAQELRFLLPPAISPISTSFPSLERGRPGFSLPGLFHSVYSLSPPLPQLSGSLQAAKCCGGWVGTSDRGRFLSASQAEAESQSLNERGRAAREWPSS